MLVKERLKKLSGKLNILSPLAILGRGYSLTFSYSDGRIIKDSKTLKKGNLIKTKLGKGSLLSEIIETTDEHLPRKHES